MGFRWISRPEGQGRDPLPATADSPWTGTASLPAQRGQDPGLVDGPRDEREGLCVPRERRERVRGCE